MKRIRIVLAVRYTTNTDEFSSKQRLTKLHLASILASCMGVRLDLLMWKATMPRFFFHVWQDSNLIADPDGSDLQNLDAAWNEALVGLRQLVADRLRGGQISDVQRIEITDETGQSLATVRLEDAPKSMQ